MYYTCPHVIYLRIYANCCLPEAVQTNAEHSITGLSHAARDFIDAYRFPGARVLYTASLFFYASFEHRRAMKYDNIASHEQKKIRGKQDSVQRLAAHVRGRFPYMATWCSGPQSGRLGTA